MAAAAVGSVWSDPGAVVFADALTKEQRDKLTPDQVIELMKQGNARFLRGEKTTHDYLAQQRASAKGQHPAAVVLSLLARIKPAVVKTAYQGERSAKNYGFVDAVARTNVELTIVEIRKRSPVLADLEAKGAIRISGAMYDLETGVVTFFGLSPWAEQRPPVGARGAGEGPGPAGGRARCFGGRAGGAGRNRRCPAAPGGGGREQSAFRTTNVLLTSLRSSCAELDTRDGQRRAPQLSRSFL